MKKYFKILVVVLISLITKCYVCGQVQNNKYYFNFVKNAESLNAYSDDTKGLIMYFRLWNKDGEIGNGGGWLIYKEGTKKGSKLAENLYPNKNRPGRYLIDDIFQRDSVNPNVDSTMINDFDIYLYLVNVKFLEKMIMHDADDIGSNPNGYISYQEKYPLDIVIYKRESGRDYFLEYKKYHINNENEYFKTLTTISQLKKQIAIESNLSK